MADDVQFTWDQAKSDTCLINRGFDFAYVAQVFFGAYLERTDARFNYGETRQQVIGEIDGLLYLVVYTQRDGVKHIISARRAHQKELDKWTK